MGVSVYIQKKVEEAMEAFKEHFSNSWYEVRLRSPGRLGGDREFLLFKSKKLIAGIHVKRDSYKMYLNDELVEHSKHKEEYERKNGGLFIHFLTVQQCIQEIDDVLKTDKA